MEEIWKDIKEFEGLYEVSNLGRVKSLQRLVRDCNGMRMRMRKERILKDYKDTHGYHRITLLKNGKRKQFSIHRLVFEAFNGEIPE